MGNKLYEENSISAIASSIRNKLGVETTYKVSEMAGAIDDIIKPEGTTSISQNGYHNVAAYEQAYVNVPGTVPVGTKNITENGDYNVANYSAAHVAVPEPTGTKQIVANGSGINVKQYEYVDVAVPSSATGTIQITADQALKTVDVSSYQYAEVAVPMLQIMDAGVIQVQNDTQSLEFPYDTTRTVDKIIVTSLYINGATVKQAKTMYGYYYELDRVNDTNLISFITYIVNKEDTRQNATATNVPAPTLDSTTGIITIPVRNSNYYFRAGMIYIWEIIYRYTPPSP